MTDSYKHLPNNIHQMSLYIYTDGVISGSKVHQLLTSVVVYGIHQI